MGDHQNHDRIKQLTDELEKVNAQHQEDSKIATTENKELLDRNERLEARYKELEDQFVTVSSEKSASDKSLDTTKEQLAYLRMENQENRTQLETTIADTSRLSDEVLAKTQEMEQFKKRSESYKTKFKESLSRLEERETELKQCWEAIKIKERNHRQTVRDYHYFLLTERLIRMF